MDPRLVELERLLVRRYEAGAILLDVDMYDRWGAAHGSPEEQAEMADRGARANAERQEVSRELAVRSRALRAEAPELIDAWCDAHEQLLTEFIASREDDERQRTEKFVASEERDGWRRVRAGTSDFVEENTFYVRVDPRRRRELLGV
ncbi:MAG TPA: hypothetical protein VF765_15395 [Polyangiaceae bacterium]